MICLSRHRLKSISQKNQRQGLQNCNTNNAEESPVQNAPCVGLWIDPWKGLKHYKCANPDNKEFGAWCPTGGTYNYVYDPDSNNWGYCHEDCEIELETQFRNPVYADCPGKTKNWTRIYGLNSCYFWYDMERYNFQYEKSWYWAKDYCERHGGRLYEPFAFTKERFEYEQTKIMSWLSEIITKKFMWIWFGMFQKEVHEILYDDDNNPKNNTKLIHVFDSGRGEPVYSAWDEEYGGQSFNSCTKEANIKKLLKGEKTKPTIAVLPTFWFADLEKGQWQYYSENLYPDVFEKCGKGKLWYGWTGTKGKIGKITTTFKASGRGRITFGNCWGGKGNVNLLLDRIHMASAGPETNVTFDFDFQYGTELILNEDGENSKILFIDFSILKCEENCGVISINHKSTKLTTWTMRPCNMSREVLSIDHHMVHGLEIDGFVCETNDYVQGKEASIYI